VRRLDWHREQFKISTDPSTFDFDLVHSFLTNSYWSPGVPRETLARAIENSLCFAVFDKGQQVGFARVITDRATFACLADVFSRESHRGRGLSKWLMECITAHPELQGLRRWSLVTRDAHGLYERFGFTPLRAPERWMERHDPDVYKSRERV